MLIPESAVGGLYSCKPSFPALFHDSDMFRYEIFKCMIQTCSDAWCRHVQMHDPDMFGYLMQTCSDTWCRHVQIHDADMFRYMMQTCSDAWCSKINLNYDDTKSTECMTKNVQLHDADNYTESISKDINQKDDAGLML